MNGVPRGDGMEEGVDGSGDEDDQQNKRSKKPKRRIKRSNQITENLDSITAKSREEFIDVSMSGHRLTITRTFADQAFSFSLVFRRTCSSERSRHA